MKMPQRNLQAVPVRATSPAARAERFSSVRAEGESGWSEPPVRGTGYAPRGQQRDGVRPAPLTRQLLLDRVREALEVDRQRRRAEAERAEVAARVARLTPRERQVMELVVSGNTNKVIAIDLGLCEKTVEVHRAHVMEKMKVQSLAELVRLAILVRPSETP